MNKNEKPTVLIGPEPSKNPLNSGSWKWFGIDLANELKQYYNIITQKNAEPLKKADCYISIKSLDFEGMKRDISNLSPGSIVLYHVCAHNP